VKKLYVISIILFNFLTFFHCEAAEKRILIFYVNLGMGTRTAAEAIAGDIQKRYPAAEIVLKDTREFSHGVVAAASKTSYEVMTRYFPWFYDETYLDYMDQGRNAKSLGDLPLSKQFRPDKILEYIHEVKPDVILSTYHVATEALIHFRDQGELKDIPIGAVHMDLVDETYFAKMALQVDMEFVVTPELRNSFIARGVPADRLIASGTPLNPKALNTVDEGSVDAFRVRKGLLSQKRTILITGGSNGVGDYPLMVERLSEAFAGEPLQIIAVCGRNEKHVTALTKLASNLPLSHNLIVERLISQDDLFLYMHLSDLIIAKTGGVTPMELFYRKKPLIFLDINGGQEFYNSDIYMTSGLGKVTRDQGEVGKLANQLLTSKDESARQLEKQFHFCENQCSWKIADWAMRNPTVQPALNHQIHLDSSQDRLRPKGLIWKCARLLRSI
jgi:processive 1,2-diacylglycerol beta-glucosyltransferase